MTVTGLQPADEIGLSEARTPVLHAVAQRNNTRLQITHAQDETIFDIGCPFGIDTATITRLAAQWPARILVRLHLQGLESLEVSQHDLTIEWSVQSTGSNTARVSLQQGQTKSILSEPSPYYTPLRIVGGNGKIPLKKGYIEVRLPDALFAENPKEIQLRWIDFYRN